jgi:hypothetical protein
MIAGYYVELLLRDGPDFPGTMLTWSAKNPLPPSNYTLKYALALPLPAIGLEK